MNIGGRIQRCRKERGWTQKQLAGKSGVPQAAISKIERGAVKPLFETVQRLAQAFEMGLDELAGIPVSRGRKKTNLEPAVLNLLQEKPVLAEALRNPEIAGLISRLSPGYPVTSKKENLQVLLSEAMKMVHSS